MDDALFVFRYFFSKYEEEMKELHPPINTGQIVRIIRAIQQAAVQAFAEMGPEFARYIVQAFVEAGMLGNIRAIEDYARVTAQKDFTLGRPSSAAGRWVRQSMEAYEAVGG